MVRQLSAPMSRTAGAPPAVIAYDDNNSLGPVTLEHGAGATGFECECQPVLGMAIPDGLGRLAYDASSDGVTVGWSKTQAMANAGNAAKQSLGLVNAAAGGSLVDITALEGMRTYHPLGGAVLGKACDSFGRVDGYPHLYVVDGALLPGSSGCCNPSLTIAAVAERCIERILREDFA
jgi:cholesterol oxidase